MTEDLATLLQQPQGDSCLGLSAEDAARFKWWLQLGLLEMRVTVVALNKTIDPKWFEPYTFGSSHPVEKWSYRFKR